MFLVELRYVTMVTMHQITLSIKQQVIVSCHHEQAHPDYSTVADVACTLVNAAELSISAYMIELLSTLSSCSLNLH